MRAADPPTSTTVTPGNGAREGGAKVATDTRVAASVERLTQPAAVPQPDMTSAVKAAAAQIDSYLKSVGRELEYRVDDETGQTVVTVRDKTTGDVIRQIPNEEVLRLARRLNAGSSALLDLSV